MRRSLLFLACFLLACFALKAQEEPSKSYKNQISTNLLLPIFGSVDFSYERSLGNKFAVGIGAAVYGEDFENLTIDDSYGGGTLRTKNEIMPFARIYFNGNQNNSHLLEVFGSFSRVDEDGRLVRSLNDVGNGVYDIGVESYTRGGFGLGYGYRFLLLDNKLALEAQFGLRTNFDLNFVVLNAALVRTGIKIGYRF